MYILLVFAVVGYGAVRSLAGTSATPTPARLAAVAAPTTTSSAPTTTSTVAPTTTSTTAPPVTTTAPPTPTTVAPPPVRALAASAPPPPAAPPAASTPASVGAAAFTRINYPWQKLGFGVSFAGSNPGLLGKANCNTKQITIYVRPTQSLQQVAFVIAFELGHAVDCGTMSDARRAEWAGIRGFAPGWQWFPGCLCTEDNYGSGDISTVFANWLVPNSGYRWRSNLAGPPSAAQLQQLMPYLRPASVG